MKTKRAAPTEILHLRITLRDIEPRIWREIQVSSSVTFARLHQILQRVFGWKDYHLYEFEVGFDRVAVYDPDYDEEEPLDPARTRLSDLKPGVRTFLYRYDFGDEWLHDVQVVGRIAPVPGVRYPICVRGERSGPPEDVGGTSGYAELLRILFDPEDEEYAHMVSWVGKGFDSESFEIAKVNAALERFRPKRAPPSAPRSP